MPQYLRSLGKGKCEPREAENVVDLYRHWRFYRIHEQRFLDDLDNIGAIVKSAVIFLDSELSKVGECSNHDAVILVTSNSSTVLDEVKMLCRIMHEIKERL